jgi:RNA polymerase sigma-70 factor, ECF subfamily
MPPLAIRVPPDTPHVNSHTPLSQSSLEDRSYLVNAPSEAVADVNTREVQFDLEAIFRAQYPRIARVIARVVRDRSCAEELAVEVFLKLWRHPQAHTENAEGWLYRVAVRTALDELRRQTRRTRYERLLGFVRGGTPTPEDLHAATEEQDRVRQVLGAIDPRRAELLVLRSHDLSYDELASALALNPASVGTLLIRAQHAFRKEYLSRYGEK